MTKRILILLTIIFSLLNSQNLPTIAVLNLEAIGMSQIEAELLTRRLQTYLVQSEEYQVLDRSNMKMILEEQSFQMSGCTSSECLVEIGQLLGVSNILTGSVGIFADTYTLELFIIDVGSGKILKSTNYDLVGDKNKLISIGIESALNRLLYISRKKKNSNNNDEIQNKRSIKSYNKNIDFFLHGLKNIIFQIDDSELNHINSVKMLSIHYEQGGEYIGSILNVDSSRVGKGNLYNVFLPDSTDSGLVIEKNKYIGKLKITAVSDKKGYYLLSKQNKDSIDYTVGLKQIAIIRKRRQATYSLGVDKIYMGSYTNRTIIIPGFEIIYPVYLKVVQASHMFMSLGVHYAGNEGYDVCGEPLAASFSIIYAPFQSPLSTGSRSFYIFGKLYLSDRGFSLTTKTDKVYDPFPLINLGLGLELYHLNFTTSVGMIDESGSLDKFNISLAISYRFNFR